MKKLVVLVIVLMMSITSFANEKKSPTSKEDKKEIRAKIIKLLGQVDFYFEKEIKTSVDVLINKNGEIVVLNVACKNPTVCAYIKRKLNYKKVTNNTGKNLKRYIFSLHIVK